MAYQMVATAVTLNDLEGHSLLADVLNAIRGTFVQHFTRFQLTVCSHGSSAVAELLVYHRRHYQCVVSRAMMTTACISIRLLVFSCFDSMSSINVVRFARRVSCIVSFCLSFN